MQQFAWIIYSFQYSLIDQSVLWSISSSLVRSLWSYCAESDNQIKTWSVIVPLNWNFLLRLTPHHISTDQPWWRTLVLPCYAFSDQSTIKPIPWLNEQVFLYYTISQHLGYILFFFAVHFPFVYVPTFKIILKRLSCEDLLCFALHWKDCI